MKNADIDKRIKSCRDKIALMRKYLIDREKERDEINDKMEIINTSIENLNRLIDQTESAIEQYKSFKRQRLEGKSE